MKRFWFAVVLLVLLLLLGLFEALRMTQLTEPICDSLTEAAQSAQKGDWTQAQRLAQEAEAGWDDSWDFFSAMNHHGPMEEIDSQFARAMAFLESRAAAEFAACCARLVEMIRALGEAHVVNLRNLL